MGVPELVGGPAPEYKQCTLMKHLLNYPPTEEDVCTNQQQSRRFFLLIGTMNWKRDI